MPLLVKTPQGNRPISRTQLAQLVAAGSVKDTARAASIDDGKTWITVSEALQQAEEEIVIPAEKTATERAMEWASNRNSAMAEKFGLPRQKPLTPEQKKLLTLLLPVIGIVLILVVVISLAFGKSDKVRDRSAAKAETVGTPPAGNAITGHGNATAKLDDQITFPVDGGKIDRIQVVEEQGKPAFYQFSESGERSSVIEYDHDMSNDIQLFHQCAFTVSGVELILMGKANMKQLNIHRVVSNVRTFDFANNTMREVETTTDNGKPPKVKEHTSPCTIGDEVKRIHARWKESNAAK